LYSWQNQKNNKTTLASRADVNVMQKSAFFT
jgi:hypothetical protein